MTITPHWRMPAAFAATAGLVLSGCGSDQSDDAAGDEVTVLASFYPLAFAAERVAGPDAAVVNLTRPGAEAHDLELTGQQVGQIADADLVVYLRGFQPAIDAAVAQNAGDRSIDVTEVLHLLDDDHDDDHDEDDHDEDDDHDHGDLEGDPHVWLDPTNMAAIAEAVADRLGELRPEQAEQLHDRADEFIAELTALDEDFSAGLADCERRIFVTSHAAFGYLAHRYDLDMVGIAGIDPDAEPSPSRLARVQHVVEDEGLTTIFYERLVSPAVARALADDLGVTAAVLDPIEGLTDETADEDYFSLMRANLDALREANGCA
jgi:zinc transport system substrate-binding protein